MEGLTDRYEGYDYTDDQKYLLQDFISEYEKISKLGYHNYNILPSVKNYDWQSMAILLIENDVLLDNIYEESNAKRINYLSLHAFQRLESLKRINPILKYEAFQFYRYSQLYSSLYSELTNFVSETLFKFSFQITRSSKIDLIQIEINEILNDNRNHNYAMVLKFDSQLREAHVVNSFYDIIDDFIIELRYDEFQSDQTKPSNILQCILCYICADQVEYLDSPYRKVHKEWEEFELKLFKLLFLRRLYKYVDLIDDFFSRDQVELSNIVSLDDFDMQFILKVKNILKNQEDVQLINKIFKSTKAPRTAALFDNMYKYLHHRIPSNSRFTTTEGVTYKNMVKNSYPHLGNFSLTSNEISEKWHSSFKRLDR